MSAEEKKMTYRILVSDPMESIGLDMLREAGHEVVELGPEDKPRLPELLGDFDALVVRSETKVTADLLARGSRLKVVGRAGIGVDNVDVRAATQQGVLVVNAPTANLISATEHTFALLLSLARNVAQADRDLKDGKWSRKRFVGTELQGKKLGVIGFGRIGQQVARRARAFDMEILAFDPFLDAEQIRRADAIPLELDELLAQADVVTLHIPFTDETRNLLGRERLAKLQPHALLVNCARGGVVDEEALLEQLEAGRLGGAALDVFAEEPLKDFRLVQHPKVVATPHLGAQTQEAQERISTQTAKMVVDALSGSLAISAVNLPFRSAGAAAEPYLRLAEKLGHLAGSLAGVGPIKRVELVVASLEPALRDSLQVAALRGVLRRSIGGEKVNYVNAQTIARERGIECRLATTTISDYPNQIAVKLVGEKGSLEVAGSLFHGGDERVVALDGYACEFRPNGHALVVRNRDVPGVVGRLGTLLGDAQVNIAEIHLARKRTENRALAVLRLDEPLAPRLLAELRGIPEIVSAEPVDFG
jgi:D-3-phosphoglycerate dehydrogenase